MIQGLKRLLGRANECVGHYVEHMYERIIRTVSKGNTKPVNRLDRSASKVIALMVSLIPTVAIAELASEAMQSSTIASILLIPLVVVSTLIGYDMSIVARDENIGRLLSQSSAEFPSWASELQSVGEARYDILALTGGDTVKFNGYDMRWKRIVDAANSIVNILESLPEKKPSNAALKEIDDSIRVYVSKLDVLVDDVVRSSTGGKATIGNSAIRHDGHWRQLDATRDPLAGLTILDKNGRVYRFGKTVASVTSQNAQEETNGTSTMTVSGRDDEKSEPSNEDVLVERARIDDCLKALVTRERIKAGIPVVSSGR